VAWLQVRLVIGKAEECFTKSIEAAKTVGDLRSVEETMIYMGIVEYFQAKVQQSVETTGKAVESSLLRGDVQIQVLAQTEQARNFYTLGEFKKCIQALSEVDVALAGGAAGNDIAAEINYYGLVSMVHFRMGESEQCLTTLEIAYNFIMEREPTAYYSFFGYAHTVELLLLILHSSRHQANPILSKSKAQQKADKALAAFGKFAKIFPFAQPRYELWSAVYNHLNGKNGKAEKIFNRSIEIAQSMGMHYEQALGLFEKRNATKRQDPKDKVAEEIFGPISSRNDTLEVLKRQQNKAAKILGKSSLLVLYPNK